MLIIGRFKIGSIDPQAIWNFLGSRNFWRGKFACWLSIFTDTNQAEPKEKHCLDGFVKV